jgi:hypothetical protein
MLLSFTSALGWFALFKKFKNCLFFLLSMNEVNIKYWFRNFQKKIFYRFSGRIRAFYRRKTDLYEKKNFRHLPSAVCRLPSAVCRDFMAVQMKKFVRPLFGRCFQVRDFSFRITEGIGLTGVSFHFWPQKQIPSGSSHTNFWLLFHFHVKYWPILMFFGLIWCKILCWPQKSILYGV